MNPPGRRLIACGSILLASAAGLAENPKKPDRPALGMSKAVVCQRVVGYEDFVELPDASLTGEDKLNVYFRPLNFRVDPVEKPRPGHRYRASFREDCRIRRKGEKAVLMKKDALVEYAPTFELPTERLYLISNIGLKSLTPGEYELDVVLHDVLEEGASATQTVAFTVVPTPKVDPPPDETKAAEPERPAAPKVDPKEKEKAKVKGKPARKADRPS